MAMTRAKLCAGWLLLSVASWSACRQVTVCDGANDCSTPPPANADAGMAGQPAPTSSGGADAGAAEQPVEAGGVAGQPERPDAGSSAGGQSLEGPSCRPGTAECDDSSLTVCETPTTFSFRHCGGCGKRCEGSCISGNCKEGEVLFAHNVENFVADSARAFVTIWDSDVSIYRVDLSSGALEVIAQNIDYWGKLVLGTDYLYVSYDDHVVRMGFDGSGIVTEPFESTSFGATKDGVYYTTYIEGAEPEPGQYALWFRPTGASTAELLRQGAGYDIVGSSRASVLVYEESADVTELLLVRGREFDSLGPAPKNVESMQPLLDGAAYLVANEQARSGYEILWLLRNASPQHFVVDAKLDQRQLVAAPDGVALLLQDRSNTFVRLYTVGGPLDVPFGISNESDLAYVDRYYLWYSWTNTITFDTTFRRARQFELTDAIPD
ncbi:MAG TPA: hypothetical protein VHP33_26950 [Polyangiaceae bacterium]|nr:hypothetical protein [Polyangiaceae bacterium]